MTAAEEKLHRIQVALDTYAWALRARMHGAVAADRTIRAIVEIMGGDGE